MLRSISIVIALLIIPRTAPLAAELPDEPGLTIFLLTMDQGDEVWEKFGHNAIWVHDPEEGSDLVYNYGVFDFDSPGYWGRFVKGDWIYQLAVSDIYNTMRQYQYLNRTVTAQELDLTPAEARELQEFLEWNRRPENAEYLYDYYRDNCSTRVRDLIDRVLDGALYNATASLQTETTYRWHSHRMLKGATVAYTGISLGIGPDGDRPLSGWEEMFLPGKLRERVAELHITRPNGEVVPLVRSEQVLFEATGRATEAVAPPSVIGWYILAGTILGFMILASTSIATRPGTSARAGQILFASLAGGWSLLIGGMGLLLSLLWAFTNHTFAYKNLNLLQTTPLALPLVVLLPALAFGARRAVRPAYWLTLVLALSSLTGLIICLLPWSAQANGDIIALVLPVQVALALAVHRLRRPLSSPPVGTSSDQPVSHRSISGGR